MPPPPPPPPSGADTTTLPSRLSWTIMPPSGAMPRLRSDARGGRSSGARLRLAPAPFCVGGRAFGGGLTRAARSAASSGSCRATIRSLLRAMIAARSRSAAVRPSAGGCWSSSETSESGAAAGGCLAAAAALLDERRVERFVAADDWSPIVAALAERLSGSIAIPRSLCRFFGAR